MKTNLFVVLSAVIMLTVSCNSGGGVQTSETGLKYEIHTQQGDDAKKPVKGDRLTLHMKYTTESDSVLFNTWERGEPLQTPLMDPAFKGGVEEGFAMLAVGDSATFMVSADSVFQLNFGMALPAFIKPGSMLKFIVKMVDFKSQADLDAQEKALREQSRGEEQSNLDRYIASNGIQTQADPQGFIYVETQAGTGANAEPGKTVVVEYTGKLLNGKVFDASKNQGKPFEMKLGEGQVIEGWELGLCKMKKGSKGSLILPSRLAYGENGVKNPNTGEYMIPPYSPLVFDIEMVDIKETQQEKPPAVKR